MGKINKILGSKVFMLIYAILVIVAGLQLGNYINLEQDIAVWIGRIIGILGGIWLFTQLMEK